MNSHLRELIRRYNLILKFMETDRNGYLVKTAPDKPDVIIVKNGLSDFEIENVILHEVGHVKNDKNVIGDDVLTCSAHSCAECGANHFMIAERIKEYVALGNEPDEANYVNIAKSIGVSNYSEVRSELLKYVTN